MIHQFVLHFEEWWCDQVIFFGLAKIIKLLLCERIHNLRGSLKPKLEQKNVLWVLIKELSAFVNLLSTYWNRVRIPSKVAQCQSYWLYEAEISVNGGYNYKWTWPDYTRRHVISNQGIDNGLKRITDIYSWITMIGCDFLTSGTLALTGSICGNLQF